jgi:hypothetical protein
MLPAVAGRRSCCCATHATHLPLYVRSWMQLSLSLGLLLMAKTLTTRGFAAICDSSQIHPKKLKDCVDITTISKVHCQNLHKARHSIRVTSLAWQLCLSPCTMLSLFAVMDLYLCDNTSESVFVGTRSQMVNK